MCYLQPSRKPLDIGEKALYEFSTEPVYFELARPILKVLKKNLWDICLVHSVFRVI